MSTEKKVASEVAEEAVNPVLEQVVQPDLTAEETAQEEPKAEVNKKAAAEAQLDLKKVNENNALYKARAKNKTPPQK